MSWDPKWDLSDSQIEKLEQYERLLLRVNEKINLISRESTNSFWDAHVVHCLALAKREFPAGAKVADWGTGGGLPAIPLAIRFPEVSFYAIDAVDKKVRSVRTFARRLRLDNLFAWHGRAANWQGSVNYSVSRATAPLRTLWMWHRSAYERSVSQVDGAWPEGLLCLKGGDLSEEIGELKSHFSSVEVEKFGLEDILEADGFRDKYIVQVSESTG